MIYRSKAPLRLGLAGGGTDVAPYSDIYGGAILNITIGMYAYASIEPLDSGDIIFEAFDKNNTLVYKSDTVLPIDNELPLHSGIYNRIVKDYTKKPLSFKLTTYVDAPPGSGLGSSSTLVVAILSAFSEWLKLPFGEYDLAQLAYSIEREDLQMAGGKQDQYAATFGGVNFMEFYTDKTIVNPLRIRSQYLNELNYNLVLYYTGNSRLSSKIIEQQKKNVNSKDHKSIEAMHQLKEQSLIMKEALLRGEIDKVGLILDKSWAFKKAMAAGISNPLIDEIYQSAINAGASGGKISGAGGGGFIFFYCPNNSRNNVIQALNKFGGQTKRYDFVTNGVTTWSN